MSFETWIAFALACFLLSLIPGPSVLLVSGQALAHGLRRALICICGEVLGGTCLMILSLLGLGALLVASAPLFELVKWLGVTYLAWLGWQQIRSAGQSAPAAPKTSGRGASFRDGMLTALLNPKSIVFYMAFLPQFLTTDVALAPQAMVLILTAGAVAGLVLGGYAVLAARAAALFRSARAQRMIGYSSGGFFLGGSVALAVSR